MKYKYIYSITINRKQTCTNIKYSLKIRYNSTHHMTNDDNTIMWVTITRSIDAGSYMNTN